MRGYLHREECYGKSNRKEISRGYCFKSWKNTKNITERTNKAHGNISKIMSTLNERPFAKHMFKAYILMSKGILLGGLLTNSKSWVNIVNQDLESLEKPDSI